MYNVDSNPVVTSCRFHGNTTGFDGAGMYNLTSSPVVTNCEFIGNIAEFDGGGIYNRTASPEVSSSTFMNNSSARGGAMFSFNNCNPTVANSIFWRNTPDEIDLRNASTTVANFCLIDGGVPAALTDAGGNIDLDPVFVRVPDAGGDAMWGTNDDDYGNLDLDNGSGAVDVGGAVLAADTADLDGDGNTGEPIPFDLTGGARVVDGDLDTVPVLDMGAHEFVFVPAVAPNPLLATGELAKTQRYLGCSAPVPTVAGASGQAIRIRVVTLDGYALPVPNLYYLGTPFQAPEEDSSNDMRTFTAAGIQCDIYVHDWSSEGIISAYGAEFMPSSTYEVERALASCFEFETNEECWSTPLTITTGKFADIVEPFHPVEQQPDFRDIAAGIAKFLGEPIAPLKSVAQLQPNVVFPDRPVDFRDISVIVQAFLGSSYVDMTFTNGTCACPSAVICGAAACASSLDCAAGELCVNGSCADACGRCRP
jgi:hypothetical protein